MWHLAREKPARAQAWPVPVCVCRELPRLAGSHPPVTLFSPHIFPARDSFLRFTDRKLRLKEVKSLAQGHLPVSGRAGSLLGLLNARFQQVVTLWHSCFPGTRWVALGHSLYAPGWTRCEISRKGWLLPSPLPAQDCSPCPGLWKCHDTFIPLL